ncbi:MAG: hypothetical protein Q9221_008921 [Calogaya cf. arnoldii]
MLNKQILALVASISAATAAANFDAGANTNMAVYWNDQGQGPSQQRLAHLCEDSSIDIIPIAFLNIFPDQVNGGYPGTNFGNQCGPETFKNKDGSDSPLLSNCPLIGPDIKTCQAMGKKLLLSLGGAIPTNQSINNDESAVAFAHFLWNAFGPVDATYNGPRPFGDAVIDGFDFDVESEVTGNDPTSQYRGYGTMINTLRVLFAAENHKDYYISGSPQCVIPDAHLAEPIETSWFDFLFIQFYNTPQCSARAYFDASYGRVGDKPSSISFDAWVDFTRTKSLNKDVKLYLGLPAAPLPALAYDTYMYIAPDDVSNLIDVFQCRYPNEFGGIMVFEATYSEQNLIDNKPFVDVLKSQLTHNKCAKTATSTSSTVSSTATSLSSASTISSTEITPFPNSTSASNTGLHNSTYSAGPTAPIGNSSSSIPSYSNTGIWNGTSSSAAITGTGSSSIATHPTSTGIWNGTSSPSSIIGTGSSSIFAHPTSTGIWNGTSSASSIMGTGSSSIPAHPTSTGIWNGTSTSSSIIGTGSSSIPAHPTSTGIWNGTSSSTAIIGSGSSSSIPPYPTSTGIWNGTSSSTVIIGTGSSSSTPPYPTSTGIWNATTSLVPSGTGFTSSSVPVNSSASTNSHVFTSSSVITGTGSASGIPLHPTGGSSGFSSSILSTSAPYPFDNSTSTATTSASGGVTYTTETITITKCPPEVTSCPIRTSVTVYPITSSSSISVISSSSVSVISSSSVPIDSSSSVPVTSVPTNGPQTTAIPATVSTSKDVIYTTETLTITKCPPEVTSCPVRTSVTVYPITSSSSLPIVTSSSVPVSSVPTNNAEMTATSAATSISSGVIYTTETITISKCPPKVTSCPVRTSVTVYPITSSSSGPVVSSSNIPITSVPANSPETTNSVPSQGGATTLIVTSYVTTCPVTNTVTTRGSTSIQTTFTVSTVTSTITSVSSPTATSVSVNSPETTSSVPSHAGATTLIVTSYVTTCPVTNTITTQGTTSIQTTFTVSTVTSTITSVISSTATPASLSERPKEHVSTAVVPAPSPGHGGSANPASPPSGSNNSPVGGSGSHPAGQSEQPSNGGSSNPAHSGSSNPGSSPPGDNTNSPVGSGNSPGSSNGGSTSPNSPASSNAGNSPSQPQQPSHGSLSPDVSTPPKGNTGSSPVNGASNSPAQGNTDNSPVNGASNSPAQGNTGNIPVNGASNSPAQGNTGNSPVNGASNSPAQGNTGNIPVNGASNSPAQGSPAEGLSTIINTSTKFHTSTIPANPASSGVGSSSRTVLVPVIVTQTLVPIPVSPEQTAQPAVSSSGAGGFNSPAVSSNGPEGFTLVQPSPIPSSAPFPANNGTATTGGPTGGSLSAPSASGTGVYSPDNVMPFTGGASKMMGSSVIALAVVMAGAFFM